MSDSNKYVEKASEYVRQYLFENLPVVFLYHNYGHAKEVAEAAIAIAEESDLSDKEKEILQLSAWFHDCGYAIDPEDVGSGSVDIAAKWLTDIEYPDKRRTKVVELLKSFHSDESPQDSLHKILRDANKAFLGRKRFFKRTKLLRMELERVKGQKYTRHEWNQYAYEMLIDHKFHTIWADSLYARRKARNISRQRENIQKAYEKTTRKKTGKNFGRGVDTLYRVTLRNHIALSGIADGKANMIISINTLVLSILITAITAGFSLTSLTMGSYIHYGIPVLILMLTALLAIIFAVLSAIPNVSGKNFDESDFKNHKVSMLFFGNFLQLEKETFVEHLRELKKDQELLYDELTKDLYNLGDVLKKKYYLLTISYRIFVGGLILSFLMFIILLFIK